MNDRMKSDLPLDLDPELDEAAKMLNETAEHITPSPAFQAALQRRLMASHSAQGDSAMFSLKKFAPAVFWVMAALVLVFVLDWAIRSLAPQPVPASRTTPVATVNAPAPPVDQPTAVPSGKTYDWRGTTLTISAAMPASPSEANVYPVQAEQHATVDQALALAQRFGIQGEAYQSQGELPGTTDYAVTDGKQFLRVRSSGYFTYTADVIKSYNFFGAITNPDAESIIAAFLSSHGYTFPYRMEWSDIRSAYAVEPLAADGVPFGYEPFSASMLLITLDESGQVSSVQASLLDVSGAPLGSYGIVSADEALQRLLDPNRSNGSVETAHSTMGPIQQWSRTYPMDQTITIYGNAASIRSVQPDKPPFIQIDGVPVIEQTAGLAEFTQPTYVEATGRFVTENGIKKFSVDSWKVSPAKEDGLVGTLKRENDRTLLTTDDGSTYSLPDVPAAIPMPFEKAFVVGTQAGELFQWKFIDNRMAAGGGGGGGGGGGAGFYKLNLSGTPVPFPTPTQAAGGDQYTVQAGDTLGSIAQSLGTTTDALIRANGIQDPNQLAVGQTILVPNASAQPVEALRGMLTITISKHQDGTQSIAYGFLANAEQRPRRLHAARRHWSGQPSSLQQPARGCLGLVQGLARWRYSDPQGGSVRDTVPRSQGSGSQRKAAAHADLRPACHPLHFRRWSDVRPAPRRRDHRQFPHRRPG